MNKEIRSSEKIPELKLVNLLNVIKDKQTRSFIQNVFFQKEKLSVSQVKLFPKEDKEELIKLAGQARDFYREQASHKNNSETTELVIALEIDNFINFL